MADETENHTIRLLQEMRSEVRGLRDEVQEMRADLSNRIDGNTLVLNMVAGLVSRHDDRFDRFEEGRG